MSEKGLCKALKRKPQRILVVTCVCIALLCVGMVVMISRYPTGNPTGQFEDHAALAASKQSLAVHDALVAPEAQNLGSLGLLAEEQSEGASDDANIALPDALAEELASMPECPLQTENTRFVRYEHNALGSSWKYQSEANLDTTVASVLDGLKSGGWSLVEDETLDLFGDFWGCIAQNDQSVLMVVAGREEIALAEGNKGDVQLTVIEMDTP